MERVNKWRFRLALVAEAMDYLRIVPRTIIVGYSWLLYEVVWWFMALESPNMEQSALVSVMVTIAGVVVGLYTKSGHSWDNPITVWTKEPQQLKPKVKIINLDEEGYSTNGSSSSNISSKNESVTPPASFDFPDID